MRISSVPPLLAFMTIPWGDLPAADPAPATESDPYVMKVYPDGTKAVIRWSEIGRNYDQGQNHGGPPRIVSWDGSNNLPLHSAEPRQNVPPPPEQADPPPATTASVAQPPPPPSEPKPLTRAIAYPDTTEQPWDRQKKDRSQKDGITLVEEYDPDEVYGRFQVGPSFVRSQSINSVNNLPTSSKLGFDTGVRGSFEIGGHLCRYLALEGNVSALWNNSQQSSDGWLLQIPVMIGLNGEFPIPTHDGPRVVPYLGLDAGGSLMAYHNLEFVPAGQTAMFSNSFGFFTPVWQVRVGVMVEFRDNWALTFGYSYLGSWGAIGEPVSSSNIQLGSIGTSSFDLGLRTFF